jgi:hypothetical protein
MLTSPFANLHNALIDRIKAKVPDIRFIDQDLGQLENYETRPPVSWPCVLIDVGDDFDYSEMGNHMHQLATGTIMLRLALVKYTDSNNLVPNNVRENSLRYYEVENDLIKALHGWAPTGFSRLLRRKASTEKREDDIRVRAIPFAISFTDEIAAPETVSTSVPNPIVTTNLNITPP